MAVAIGTAISTATIPVIRPRIGSAAHRHSQRVGVALAVVSALSFGVSGPFAKVLFAAGWTPGAAVLARVGGGALALGLVALWMTKGDLLSQWIRAYKTIIVLGIFGVAGAQLCYYNAVQFVPVSVALLIEYAAPIIVLLWMWFQTRITPALGTMVGAGVTVAGLMLVIDLGGATSLDPRGILWASAAAIANSVYFVIAGKPVAAKVQPIALAAGSLVVGGIVVLITTAVGLTPVVFSFGPMHLGTVSIPWWLPLAVLMLVTAAAAYGTGIAAATHLGPSTASFLALLEVVFAIIAAWVLLGQIPTANQLGGAALVLCGLVLVRIAPKHG